MLTTFRVPGTWARNPSLGETQGRWLRTLARAESRESLWALQRKRKRERERNRERFMGSSFMAQKKGSRRDAKYLTCLETFTFYQLSLITKFEKRGSHG